MFFTVRYYQNTSLFKFKGKAKRSFYQDFEKLDLLDSFWQKSLVAEGKDNDCCFMFYDSLYEIPEMDRKILGLPIERDITAKVRSKGILYRSNFNVTAQLYLNHEPLGKLFRRHKNIVYFGKEYILLPKEIYDLLSEIEKYSTTDNPVEQAKFVAKIKYKAKLAGAELDKILQAEEVYFPDKLDVEIKKHSDEHLELFPKLGEEIDEIIKDAQRPLASYNTLRGEGINRRRIFLEDNVKQSNCDYQSFNRGADNLDNRQFPNKIADYDNGDIGKRHCFRCRPPESNEENGYNQDRQQSQKAL